MGLDRLYTGATSDNYELEYHKGNLAGHAHIRKFFENPVFQAVEDAWDQGGTYTYTAAAGADYYIASSNNGDNQDIVIGLLDVDYNIYEIFLTLTGQTPVQIVKNGVKWLRAFRIKNNDSTVFAGTVSLIEGSGFTAGGVPSTATTIRATVKVGKNQTLMCHFTTPANYWGIFDQNEMGCLKKQAALVDATLYVREEGKVFLEKDRSGLITTGNSAILKPLKTTKAIPPKSDIKITVLSDAVGMAMTGSYEILLVRSDLVNKWDAFEHDPNFVRYTQ